MSGKYVYSSLFETVGNTPLVKIKDKEFKNINFFAKLEFYNPTGSLKDRAAFHIINKVIRRKIINKKTIIIESSSGNFGIALSAYCKVVGLKFHCVIDPNILPFNEKIIRLWSNKTIKITKPDQGGGYVINRIKYVKNFVKKHPNSYWVNQYGNPYNAEAYYNSLGREICEQCSRLDYIFIAVSSGGTIAGVSRRIKKEFPQAKVIAVDVVGSLIFGDQKKTRYIPGIGSSIVPSILKHANFDEVVMIDELETIKNCNWLLKQAGILAGGSSGTVTAAVKAFFKNKKFKRPPIVVAIFPDRGERYSSTVYNPGWCKNLKKESKNN